MAQHPHSQTNQIPIQKGESHQQPAPNGVPRQPPQPSHKDPEGPGIHHPDGTVSLRNGVPPPAAGSGS